MGLYNTVHFELSRPIDAAFWERVCAALAARRRELWFARDDRTEWRRVEAGVHPPVGLPVGCLLAGKRRPGRSYVIANAYEHMRADDPAHRDWTHGIEIVPYSYLLEEPYRSALDARQGLFGLRRIGDSTGLLEDLQRAIADALDGVVHDSRFGTLRWPDGEVTVAHHEPEPPFGGPWELVDREDGSPGYRLRGRLLEEGDRLLLSPVAGRPAQEVGYRLRIDPEGWDAPQPTFFLRRDRGSQVFLGATDAAEVEWLGPAPPDRPRRLTRGRALLLVVAALLLVALLWRR